MLSSGFKYMLLDTSSIANKCLYSSWQSSVHKVEIYDFLHPVGPTKNILRDNFIEKRARECVWINT